MAARKEIRSDNTYIISTDDTDNPKLGAKILSDGIVFAIVFLS